MNPSTENLKSAVPFIAGPIIISPLHVGDSLPDTSPYHISITNGASTLIFTDDKGYSIAVGPKIHYINDPAEGQFPPYTIKLKLNSALSHFDFTGIIGEISEEGIFSPIKEGFYTFYIRAQNTAGWGNICMVNIQILAAAKAKH
jgi:hypothetical protein